MKYNTILPSHPNPRSTVRKGSDLTLLLTHPVFDTESPLRPDKSIIRMDISFHAMFVHTQSLLCIHSALHTNYNLQKQKQ